MEDSTIKEIWQLVYSAFESQLGAHQTGNLLYGKNQANEIQFRLMQNIPKLKEDTTHKAAVLADVQLAETLGLFTNETSRHIQELLEEKEK